MPRKSIDCTPAYYSYLRYQQKGIKEEYGLQKQLLPVSNCRNISKKDLIHNDKTPDITVNPETYEVRVDGEKITCEPLKELSLAQRYFYFNPERDMLVREIIGNTDTHTRSSKETDSAAAGMV